MESRSGSKSGGGRIVGQLIFVVAGGSVDVAPSHTIEAALVSTPTVWQSKTSLQNIKKYFKKCHVQHRMLDSGGYQIYRNENMKPEIAIVKGKIQAILKKKKIIYDPTAPVHGKGVLNLTPEHIVEAAQAIRAHSLHALDYPVPHSICPSEQEYQFQRSVYYNTYNAIRTGLLRERECPQTDFMVPAQVYNLPQLEIFMHLLGTQVIIDGLSLPVRNHTVEDVCLLLIQFYKMGLRKVHILGSSKFSLIAVLAYFAKNYFDLITFDSTSWLQCAINQCYIEPHTLNVLIINNDRRLITKPIVCSCHVCRYLKNFFELLDYEYLALTDFLRQHNYHTIIETTRLFLEHADNPVKLRNFLFEKAWTRKKEIDKIFKTLCTVDNAKNLKIEHIEALLKK
jgi:queuine/archaeosine tRNA-ribosyltransferase